MPSKMLVPVVMDWLRHAPKWLWGKDPAFERQKNGKGWYDPTAEPDPQRIAAELIVSEMDRLGWTMCHPCIDATQELLQPPCEGCEGIERTDQEPAQPASQTPVTRYRRGRR